MLHDQDLSKFLWGEATKTAVYFQNKSPHRSLGNITPKEVFIGKRPNINHLRIFGYPVYINIPKGKRKTLDPVSKKGIFVGYSNSSKAYRIYIKGHQIEITRDVIFDESTAFKKSKDLPSNSDEEDLPMFEEEVNKEEVSHHEEEGPSGPISLLERRKRPNWLTSRLQEAKGHTARGRFRESKKLKRYSGYATYMSKLIEDEPSTFEEATKHQEWKNEMNEEYQSIMKNRVWEIVPRLEN